MMEAKRVFGEDRISELPVHIIHQILYQTEITPEEAAQTCVLSKRWYNFWISRPNLVLNQERNHCYMSWEDFVNYVDQSLRPHVEQNLHLEQFSITCKDHQKLAPHIDSWIDLVVKLNVKVLELHPTNFDTYYYSLPDAIYAARELAILTLERCKFEFDISATNTITFCNLKILDLRNVYILEDQLRTVFARCPFIMTLQLINCKEINKLHIFGLVHLENLVVVLGKLKSLIVRAPNLRYFGYGGMAHLSEGSEGNLVPCKIAIVDAYNTLETLKLWGAITEQQFQDMFSKHSNISELVLESSYELNVIEIASEKLKKLTLSKLRNLEQVKIQAPNLTEFVFEGHKMPFNVPHFVQKFDYSKGLILAIFFHKSKAILIYEDPKEIVIPPSGDEVRILIRPILHLESFIDDLMDMYPKIMSIVPSTKSKLLQVLPTLIGCPDNTKTKRSYWQCQLKEVSTYTIEKEMDVVWYSWLKSTSLFDQVTTFMFKWYCRP